jgi:hypothetical protein
MNSIRSIYIPHVEEGITAEYIMDVIYSNGIATVSRITLIPYYFPSKYSGETYKQAFIDIYAWHETETAYEFIQALKYSPEETRLVHSADNWWVVEVNPKPWITTVEFFDQYTTVNLSLVINANNIICMMEYVLQQATNEYGAKLLEHLSNESEWLSIEKSLFDEKAYQQLEDDLCL